jgi:two-component sensor histidine kinase
MNTTIADDKPRLSVQFQHDMSATHDWAQAGQGFAYGAERRPLLHDLRSHGRHYRSDDAKRAGAPPSRFEQIASAAAGVSPERIRLLGILLAAGSAASCGGRPVLRPVWATEALHRSHNVARLIGCLEQRMPVGQGQSPDFETRLGVQLAATFDSLAITYDEEPRACSEPLRAVVRDLVELFGPAAGPIAVTTRVDRLTLSAFRQRALVLMANELVTNALLHAFQNQHLGRITLELSVLDRHTARLIVTDDGDCVADRTRRCSARCSVLDYLADLLETELVYRSSAGSGVIAEVEIPLRT